MLAKYDVLMVADEVITGFFRTGRRFACETFGIRPDILVVAKQLSSAYLPISAVILNEKVYGPIRELSGKNGILGTGFTYSGHPVPAAVALETLKIYDEMDIGAHVRKVSKHARERLAGLGDHPIVGDASGVGLVGSVELVKDKETKESFDLSFAAWTTDACTRRGVLLRACTGGGIRIAFCPPLIIKEHEIDAPLRSLGARARRHARARARRRLDVGALVWRPGGGPLQTLRAEAVIPPVTEGDDKAAEVSGDVPEPGLASTPPVPSQTGVAPISFADT